MTPLTIPFTGHAPVHAHPGDAGADLVSAIDCRLEPGERRLVPTGTRIALPQGHLGFVVPRSGLAAKHGITIVNSPGTIDSGYRGELMVTLLNTDREAAFDIRTGDRIAQLIVLPFPQVRYQLVDELPDGERVERGFGSTGVASAASAPAPTRPLSAATTTTEEV